MDFNNIADSLDRMAVQQQAITSAAEAFRKLGSIDGATKEAEKRQAAMVDEVNASLATLNQINTDIDDAKVKMQDRVDKANTLAGEKIADAVDRANSIEKSAVARGDEIIATAKEQADKLRADTEAALAATNTALATARADFADMQTKQRDVEDSTNATQEKMDKLRAAIAELKAS